MQWTARNAFLGLCRPGERNARIETMNFDLCGRETQCNRPFNPTMTLRRSFSFLPAALSSQWQTFRAADTPVQAKQYWHTQAVQIKTQQEDCVKQPTDCSSRGSQTWPGHSGGRCSSSKHTQTCAKESVVAHPTGWAEGLAD